MGKARTKKFYLDDEELVLDFGTYAILMYYALQLNDPRAKSLFDATSTEWGYRINYDFPLNGLTSSDSEAHFIVSEIQEAITFIENELTSALNSENQDLLVKYGGRSVFKNVVNSNTGIIGFIGLDDDEFYFDDPESLIDIADRLKKFLQAAFASNRPYEVIP